jgi:outer membrane autotransporter protein
MVITPVASLTYSRLHQDSYTERSSGAMALDVDSQDNDSIVSGLGLKGLVPIATDTVVEGRALWLHEFGDDAQVVTANFAAGGGTFTAAGPGVGRDSADLGVGVLAQIGFNSTFQINYDANVREDYLAHVGSARVDIHF